MRFVFVAHPPHLPARWIKIYEGRASALAALATHKERAEYFRKHGSWKVLKSWLIEKSYGKCWYCEAKLERAAFDVDHFRPKLGITVDGAKMPGDSGYYWIAYEWWNFRLSCPRCNRPEKDSDGITYGKANEFPLQDEAKRCCNPGMLIEDESPKLLDPCDKNDWKLLAYGIDGETKPVSNDGEWDCQRARFTIKQLGLNAFSTPEKKRNDWQLIDTLIRVAGNHPEVANRLAERMSPEHEYSSFFRSVIGTHRDKAWVEALL